MDLAKKGCISFFTITLLFSLLVPSLFPSARFLFFVPFLITTYYQKSFATCLWLSFLCGFILDILSSSFIGLHALNYCLATGLLFSQRKHFFSDSLSTLPLMTYFFSFFSTLLEAVLVHTFDTPVSLSLHWFFTDLMIMPLLDGIYAFICFIVPFYFFGIKQRKGKDYFLSR